MSVYNVDFFDFNLNSIHHDSVMNLSMDNDYLSPSENAIEILKTNKVDTMDLIYIKEINNFLGVVTKVSTKDNSTEISFKPFISLFDHDVLVNTKWQGNTSSSKTFETTLRDLIQNYWIGSDARAQDISSILETPVITSSTSNWRIGLKADQDGGHYCITGLYSTLISKALSKYRIAVRPSINFSTKKIILNIGKVSDSKAIEADLDNVIIETFTIKQASSSVNKLEIWNANAYSSSTVKHYYLHTNGSYSESSSGSIKPVVLQVSSVTPEEGQSFNEAADEEANNVFSGIEWTNLIELSVDINDKLINPLKIKYGTLTTIYKNGIGIPSILTGIKINDNDAILVFGSVRLDLTKRRTKR